MNALLHGVLWGVGFTVALFVVGVFLIYATDLAVGVMARIVRR